MDAWRQIVPADSGSEPTLARRFFVDPYRPETVVVAGNNAIYRSTNAGATFTPDQGLTTAVTADGSYPVGLMTELSRARAVLDDMLFDPWDSRWQVALGPAGVFQTLNGKEWVHLILADTVDVRPRAMACDFVRSLSERTLFVATRNAGFITLAAPPPLRTLSVRDLADRCLDLTTPMTLQRDIFTVTTTASLWTRLSDIEADCN